MARTAPSLAKSFPARSRDVRAPRDRNTASDKPEFFPNEIARLMALPGHGLEYRQLRTFYRYIRDPGGTNPPGREWARWTITDLASLLEAVRVCGGNDRVQFGRRLTVTGLGRALMALSQQGYSHPLLQLTLSRRGRTVFVDVDGAFLDPATGQTSIETAVAEDNLYLQAVLLEDPNLGHLLAAEINLYRDSVRYPAS